MNKTVIFRHEMKFIISNAERAIIENSLRGIMSRDKNATECGYGVRSIYFDDYENSCYYDNENGNDPREKFRIRTYDCNPDKIRLELKSKHRGLTGKKQSDLSKSMLYTILSGKPLNNFSDLPPLVKKFELQRKTRLLCPAVTVDYRRMPYVYPLGNVRITFDSDVSSSVSFSDFLSEDMIKRPFLQTDMLIMEVKYDGLLPKYIERIIRGAGHDRSSFSKYYLARKYSLSGGFYIL